MLDVPEREGFARTYALAHNEIGACPIEAGVIGCLADNECAHGSLPSDRIVTCDCWPGRAPDFIPEDILTPTTEVHMDTPTTPEAPRKRTLSPEHKAALAAGRQRAAEAKRAAKAKPVTPVDVKYGPALEGSPFVAQMLAALDGEIDRLTAARDALKGVAS